MDYQQPPCTFAPKKRNKHQASKNEKHVTSSKRRKLERIKAPVVVFRKTKAQQGKRAEALQYY